jgi:hypothetical protein
MRKIIQESGVSRIYEMGGGSMERNLLSLTPLDGQGDSHGAIYEQDLSEVGFDIFRSPGIGLIFALLVSLGLWAVIWRAVVYLASWVAG